MKIIFDRQQILAATAPLMCAATGKSTLKAIEGILIEAKQPDTCTLTTYDLEKGLRTTVEAKVLEEGTFIVNAMKFMQTMRVMDGDEVMLTVNSDLSAVIACGKSSHKMIALAGSDFPDLPILSDEHGFTVAEGTFKRMFQKTMHAMGVNDQRAVLNGCFVQIEPDRMLVVSCDSFKLAKCLLHTELQNNNADGSDLRAKFIIPIKTVNEIYKLLSDSEDKMIKILTMRKYIVFLFENLTFFSRLVDGDYIDFDRIIIQQHKVHAVVDRDTLIAALDRAALITEERVAGSIRSNVKLQFEGDLLKVLASSAAGSTYDEIDIEHEGSDLLIAFNNKYLIDSIRACECEKVKISLSSPLTSVNFEPDDGKDEACSDLFMLLPVRMKE